LYISAVCLKLLTYLICKFDSYIYSFVSILVAVTVTASVGSPQVLQSLGFRHQVSNYLSNLLSNSFSLSLSLYQFVFLSLFLFFTLTLILCWQPRAVVLVFFAHLSLPPFLFPPFAQLLSLFA